MVYEPSQATAQHLQAYHVCWEDGSFISHCVQCMRHLMPIVPLPLTQKQSSHLRKIHHAAFKMSGHAAAVPVVGLLPCLHLA